MKMIINHLSRGFIHTLLVSAMVLLSGTVHAKQHKTKTHHTSHATVTHKHKPAKHEIRRKGITGKFVQTGLASWYGSESGSVTATGAHFNPHGLTAAHRYLALPTKVRITNLKNHKQVIVVVNDRGPYVGKRVIDLSKGAAQAIGLNGVGMVKIEALT